MTVARALQMLPPKERLLRFGLVGGIGFVVDASMLSVFHYGFGVNPFAARIISIVLAAFTTWRLNRSVTFGPSDHGQAKEGFRYYCVAAFAAAINYGVYSAILLAVPGFPPVLATIAATACAMMISYAGYSKFVFRRSKAGPGN
ncbi:MAG: GtrA family protein [Hyphomicrobiales bacterium]|nr:GtrA family protein [Hyphomicrobiales bacterium]